MPRFVFRFEAVLKYRRHLRDLRRQMLADVQAELQRCAAERESVNGQITSYLEEMREQLAPGPVRLDGPAARRYYSSQLKLDVRQIDTREQLIRQQFELCRQGLVQADQQVRTLERLAEQQLTEFRFEQEKRAAAMREEAWMNAHLRERTGL